MRSNKIKAGDLFPSIRLNTLADGELEIAKPLEGKDWHMVVVYRGKHCPICTRYLSQLEQIKDKFNALNISMVAVSADSESKATAHNQEMALSFPVAYGLSVEQMEQLGLYISHPRSPQETDTPFAEPGIYVINEKGQVQVTDISNAPFARPDLANLVGGLGFIRNPTNNYPIRGTFEA